MIYDFRQIFFPPNDIFQAVKKTSPIFFYHIPRASTKALSAGLVSCKAFICCNAYISGIIKGLICSSKLDFNGDCGGNADLVKFNILKKEKEFTHYIHFEIMRNLADQSPISDWTQIQKKIISSVCVK